jgi:putative copper resistance protein D
VIVDALSISIRALSFVALFQAAGVAMFIALFGRELTASERPARKIGAVSAIVAIVLVLAHYLLEAARMAGELGGIADSTLQGMVMQSPAGTALAWREVGLLLIAIGLLIRSTRGIWLALLGALFAISAFTQVGHTAAHENRWMLSVLLLIHLFVIAFWFGALMPLRLVSSLEPPERASRTVEGFSRLAVWLVPVLFFAGLVLGAALLETPDNLATTYGKLLIVKMMAFAILMVFAALNRWRLRPTTATFRRSIGAEIALITAVLALTALLTTLYSPEG